MTQNELTEGREPTVGTGTGTGRAESPYTYDRLLIGGRWEVPAGNGMIEIRSPHDHRFVGRTPEASTKDVDRAVAAARAAFDHGPWPRMTPPSAAR